jgi:hypothetical protein
LQKRNDTLVFPTPLSPISTNLTVGVESTMECRPREFRVGVGGEGGDLLPPEVGGVESWRLPGLVVLRAMSGGVFGPEKLKDMLGR